MPEVKCAGCGAPGCGPGAVRLDLDTKATPPEHVCVKCKRKPKCSRCRKRRGRVNLDGVCERCIRASARAFAASCRRTCTLCGDRVDVADTNDYGECQGCALARMYREHPILGRGAAAIPATAMPLDHAVELFGDEGVEFVGSDRGGTR